VRRLVVGSAVLLLAGCGGSASTTAADQVPGLGDRLEQVDSFVAAHEWTRARAALRGIVTEANTARADGDLDAVSADRVVATAERLLAALPATVRPTATPTPSHAATAPTGTQLSHDDKGRGGDGKGGKKGKGKKH
jgi:hypothetical protein